MADDSTIQRMPEEQPDPMGSQQPAPVPDAAADRAAEVYVHAVAAVEGIPQGTNGWLPNNEKTRALIDRALVEVADPPARP